MYNIFLFIVLYKRREEENSEKKSEVGMETSENFEDDEVMDDGQNDKQDKNNKWENNKREDLLQAKDTDENRKNRVLQKEESKLNIKSEDSTEKFIIRGKNEVTNEKFSLILPLGKKYKIEAKIYTEPLQPHRLIREAVRFGNSYIGKRSDNKPKIETKNYETVPLYDTLHDIFSNHPLPLNQGPVILPLDCYKWMDQIHKISENERWTLDFLTKKEMLSKRTEFEHKYDQSCYEWIPTDDGISCWGIDKGKLNVERNSYKVREISYRIEGPASSKENMNIMYTCKYQKCTIYCPCQICKDRSEYCKAQCKLKMCNKCSRQCKIHDLKFPRLIQC